MVCRAPGAEIDEAFRSESATVVVDRDLGQGRFAILRDPQAGFLVRHSYYGRFRVHADGLTVACAPDRLPDWEWQRLLVGQLLPLAAAIRGREPVHGSGVEAGGRALLLLGPSGSGKTSVALHAAARGARFLADDVIALSHGDGRVIGHPGARLASVDPAEAAALPGGEGAFGRRLGVLEGEARLELRDGALSACPVAAVVILTRGGAEGPPILAPLAAETLPTLLGATFLPYYTDRRRLADQLDVLAQLAEQAPVYTLGSGPGATASDVAELALSALS